MHYTGDGEILTVWHSKSHYVFGKIEMLVHYPVNRWEESMEKIIRARYKRGLIEPLEKLGLEEGEEVRDYCLLFTRGWNGSRGAQGDCRRLERDGRL